MRKILFVEDVPEMQLLVKNLLAASYDVSVTSSASDAWELVRRSSFDLILLDLNLPDQDGLRLCTMVKEQYKVPIVIVSGRSDVSDRVKGLTSGASDYIVKPFSPLELKARVDVRMRELETSTVLDQSFQILDLTFNVPLQQVTVRVKGEEKVLSFTPIEFRILLHLSRHFNQYLTRKEILAALWGKDTHVIERTIDVHVCKLRKKIELSRAAIVGRSGRGYCLTERSVK